MTIDEAIAEARALQEQADAGWPRGFTPISLRIITARLLRIFEAHATSPERAHAIVEQLEEVKEAW
jgi:hypothetical protein